MFDKFLGKEENAQEEFNTSELIVEIRQRIGAPSNGEMFTEDEVTTFVEEKFDYLQENRKSKLVEAFMADEVAAAQRADEADGSEA